MNKSSETMADIAQKEYYKGVRELVPDTKPPPLKYAVASNLTEEQAQIDAGIAKKYKCTVSAAIRYIISTFAEQKGD